jgi:hypothetical protein
MNKQTKKITCHQPVNATQVRQKPDLPTGIKG